MRIQRRVNLANITDPVGRGPQGHGRPL